MTITNLEGLGIAVATAILVLAGLAAIALVFAIVDWYDALN